MKIGHKVVVFTDIHLGLRNNEKRHNEECLEFVQWLIQEAQAFGADYSLFCGDWNHSRSTTQTRTLNYSNKAFNLLNSSFKKHYHIIGNHDLFLRDQRDIHSVVFADNLTNIQVINDITNIGDIVLSPWLVGNESKKIVKVTQPYVFGHFEFPSFLMNAMVAMPDTGHISADNFKTANQTIFSGHFHKRQIQTNLHGAKIIYMGNCFPHSFSDSEDDDRGIMLLELGKEPIFKAWPRAPKFRTLTLIQLIEDPSKYLDDRTNARVTIDLDISYEESNFIRETMMQEYSAREFKLLPNKDHISTIIDSDGMTFNSIDEIVIQQLNTLDSVSIDKSVLVDIYNNI